MTTSNASLPPSRRPVLAVAWGARLWRALQALLVAAVVAGCGGGGSDGDGDGGSGGTTPGTPAAITAQPANQTALVGGTAVFTVVASGSSLSYQWQSSAAGSSTWAPIAGASGPTLTLSAVALADNGRQFRVAVSNPLGSTTSAAVSLSVAAAGPAPKSVVLAVGDTVCAGRSNGTLACWGTSGEGLVPGATTGTLLRPATATGVPALSSLQGGLVHLCGLTATANVLCWGYSFDGQLGNGVQFSSNGALAPLAGMGGSLAVTSGEAFSCAIKADRTVACWGRNENGQLGIGSTSRRLAPAAVPGLADVTAISAGGSQVCALRASGLVSCWGSNRSGELGDGTTQDRSSPVVVPGLSGVTAIAAGGDDFSFGVGFNHTCALKSDGTVWCWGLNNAGQLGRGTTSDAEPVPRAVPGLTGVTAISAGRGHSCALKNDGTVACWGSNGGGQLGIGSEQSQSRPTAVPGLVDVVAVVAGGYNTCAVKSDGSLFCWGSNQFGGLGDGTLVSKSVPRQVAGVVMRLF